MMFKIQQAGSLRGEIKVSGSKNAALPLLGAYYMINKEISLENIPNILDVTRFQKVAENAEKKSHTYYDLTDELVTKMRASILLIPYGLRKWGKVKIAGTGGCKLGKRSLNTFDDAFAQAGIEVKNDDQKTYTVVGKPSSNIILQEFSVTTTEALLIYLAFHDDIEEVTLYQVAIEPHVYHLIDYLNLAGANITLHYNHSITIKKGSIRPRVNSFSIVGDYLEVALFMCLAAIIEDSDITITGCPIKHLFAPINVFKQIGVDHTILDQDVIRVCSSNKKNYNPVRKLESRIYPGFPTDMQPTFTVLLTQCHGMSKIFETLFEGRFAYLAELENLGAHIEILNPHQALIFGPTVLHGGYVASTDIRGGGAMIVAGALAQGETIITNEEMILRGYDNIIEKLQKLGIDIEKID